MNAVTTLLHKFLADIVMDCLMELVMTLRICNLTDDSDSETFGIFMTHGLTEVVFSLRHFICLNHQVKSAYLEQFLVTL